MEKFSRRSILTLPFVGTGVAKAASLSLCTLPKTELNQKGLLLKAILERTEKTANLGWYWTSNKGTSMQYPALSQMSQLVTKAFVKRILFSAHLHGEVFIFPSYPEINIVAPSTIHIMLEAATERPTRKVYCYTQIIDGKVVVDLMPNELAHYKRYPTHKHNFYGVPPKSVDEMTGEWADIVWLSYTMTDFAQNFLGIPRVRFTYPNLENVLRVEKCNV